MTHFRIVAALAMSFAALSSTPVSAQTPARFPALADADVEHVVRNATCARTISSRARRVGDIDGWRAYGIRICSEDFQPAGAVVAWMNVSERTFITTLPDGRTLPRTEEAWHNLGDQQAQLTVFGYEIDGVMNVCWYARHRRLTEPFNMAFCEPRQ